MNISLLWCKLNFRPQEIWWKPAAAWSSNNLQDYLIIVRVKKKKAKLSFLSHLFFPPVSSRCDARAAVWRNPVCLQRGRFSRQPPTLLQLQLCLDRPAAGHWLRQLPVSTPTHTGVYLCKRRRTKIENKWKQMEDHAGRDLESCQAFSQDSFSKPENNIWWCLAACCSKRTDWGWLTSIRTSWGKLQMFNHHPARKKKKLAGQLNCWSFKYGRSFLKTSSLNSLWRKTQLGCCNDGRLIRTGQHFLYKRRVMKGTQGCFLLLFGFDGKTLIKHTPRTQRKPCPVTSWLHRQWCVWLARVEFDRHNVCSFTFQVFFGWGLLFPNFNIFS